MKRLLLFLCSSVCLLAADATGTWKGSLLVPGQDGNEMNRPAHLVLKQEGAKLTGTAGPDENEQHEILNGRVEGDVITFEIQNDDSSMKFTLKLEGDEIKGELTREHEGAKQKARLSVKRSQ